MELADEEGDCPSNTTAQHLTAAWFTDYKRSAMSHSFNLPTVHCAQRSEFNTMANTLHYYQLQHARTEIFLYPRASENFSDVSQKAANGTSSSIRTMKSLRPIRGAPDWALANGVRAPPRVMLESWRLKTLRIACVPSHTAIAEHWDPAIVPIGKYHTRKFEVFVMMRTTITFINILLMCLPRSNTKRLLACKWF